MSVENKEETPYEKRARERAEKAELARAAIKVLQEANDLRYWDIEDEHGKDDVERILFGGVDMVVIKRPDALEYKRTKQTIARKQKSDGSEIEALAYKCVVYPKDAAFEALQKKHPGAIGAIANAVVKMAGALDEAEGKG